MKAIVLTDSGNKHGMGHISRCTALVQAFQKYGIESDIVINDENSYVLKDFEIVKFVNWHQNQFDLELEKYSFCVIDSYLTNPDTYLLVYNSKCVCIFFIDNNISSIPGCITITNSLQEVKIKGSGLNLNGLKYLPLRKEFWNLPEKKIDKKISKIVLSFGLSTIDENKMSLGDYLKKINYHFSDANISVIISETKAHKKIIEENSAKLVSDLRSTELINLLRETDLVISAGGQFLLESIAMGVPSISFLLASNQKNNLAILLSHKVIGYAGEVFNANFIQNLERELVRMTDLDLRVNLSKSGQKIIDGLGAHRIAKAALNQYYFRNITVRYAMPSDSKQIFDLSNDEQVRLVSFNSDRIIYENHFKWYSYKLKDKNTLFLIAELNGIFKGQIRYEIEDGIGTLSISLVKDVRRKGFGEVFFQKSLNFLQKDRFNISLIYAYVKEENASSRQFFEKLGFTQMKNIKRGGLNSLLFMYKVG